MDHWLRDLRYAFRQLGRAPGLTAVAVMTLGLGIGATTSLFSVVHGVLLRALPYTEPERIVRLFEVDKDGRRSSQMSDPNFADLEEQSRSFAGLAQYQTLLVSVSGGSEPARVRAAQVSRDFFRVMAVRPHLGRGFAAEDQREGATPTALVGFDFWQRYLGGDQDFAASRLKYGDQVVSVIGVMPPGFRFHQEAELWIPRELEPLTPSRTALNKKVIGRLAADVSVGRARDELSRIAGRLAEQHGDDTWMVDVAVSPLHEEVVGGTRPALLLLLGASVFLLLIACANVINLLLARATARGQELAVRVVLGASRARLARLFLAESLLLALLGGALGVLVARWGVGLLRALDAGNLPRLADVRVDGTVLLFALLISVLVAGGLTLLAAWRATGNGLRAGLVSGQRNQAGAGTAGLRGTLVVSQVALALMLLVGTGLLLRSFQLLARVEPGYRTQGALVLNCYLPYPSNADQVTHQRAFYERLMSRLEGVPGVATIGGVDALPLHRRGANGTFLLLNQPDEAKDWKDFETLMKIPGRSGSAEFRRAQPGYFQAMQIPLLRGRLFDDGDQPESAHVAVVSAALAKAAWPQGDPIGKLVQYGNMDGDLRPFTVVGVVGDIRDASLEAEPRPTFYANAHQRSNALTGPFDIVIVAERDPTALIEATRKTVREVDPNVAPSIQTLEGILASSVRERRFQLLLLAVFGATALILAVVGIYGVISFHVAQRNQEFGVRLALGATGDSVVKMVIRQGLFLVGFGVVLGLAGAFALTRLMRSLLFEVTTTDPLTFFAVPLVLVLAAVLACSLPAYRAARVDPIVALRGE